MNIQQLNFTSTQRTPLYDEQARLQLFVLLLLHDITSNLEQIKRRMVEYSSSSLNFVLWYIYIYISSYVCTCACVCVCKMDEVMQRFHWRKAVHPPNPYLQVNCKAFEGGGWARAASVFAQIASMSTIGSFKRILADRIADKMRHSTCFNDLLWTM